MGFSVLVQVEVLDLRVTDNLVMLSRHLPSWRLGHLHLGVRAHRCRQETPSHAEEIDDCNLTIIKASISIFCEFVGLFR